MTHAVMCPDPKLIHPYGQGPFCEFEISPTNEAGVYVLVVDAEIKYVGETVNLNQRFNSKWGSYGHINVRNCYSDGQRTNCRINTLILKCAEERNKIEFFFHNLSISSKLNELESLIRRTIRPEWNLES